MIIDSGKPSNVVDKILDGNIDDFIEALVRGMKLDNIIHPINVGQEKGYSISESAKLIKEEMTSVTESDLPFK